MIQRAWKWLRGKTSREGATTTTEADELLRQSEDKLQHAENVAAEAQELTASLHQMRVENGFRERMVLKIQGGLR
jgi:hypothetical protein